MLANWKQDPRNLVRLTGGNDGVQFTNMASTEPELIMQQQHFPSQEQEPDSQESHNNTTENDLHDKPTVTEFRQPLQVQSHLEMPRILVQLGHTQRTWKLAPQTDPKWSPTRSSTRYQDQMSVKCTRRTLRMPSFTRAPHAQPSLSNLPDGTQILASRPAHAGRPDSNEIFQLPPKIKRPNLHIVRYTCHCEQYQPHT